VQFVAVPDQMAPPLVEAELLVRKQLFKVAKDAPPPLSAKQFANVLFETVPE
jgi:hypothetical protein